MKRVLPAATLILTLLSSPAWAHIVEVTTSVPLTNVNSREQLHAAIRSAVDDVVKEVIAFTPTLIALADAHVIRDRMYLRLVIADEEGERALEEEALPPGESPEARGADL